jgi:hypothetical protein
MLLQTKSILAAILNHTIPQILFLRQPIPRGPFLVDQFLVDHFPDFFSPFIQFHQVTFVGHLVVQLNCKSPILEMSCSIPALPFCASPISVIFLSLICSSRPFKFHLFNGLDSILLFYHVPSVVLVFSFFTCLAIRRDYLSRQYYTLKKKCNMHTYYSAMCTGTHSISHYFNMNS